MSFSLSTLAIYAVVVATWVAIWQLRKRKTNFSLVALFALLVGIPIGLVAREHVEAIKPVGLIYVNVLVATVAPLIFVAIVSSVTSLGSLAKLRSIGARSIFWLLLSNGLAVVLALGLALTFQPGQGLHNQLGTASAQTIEGQVQDFGQVVVGFFPTNVVESFSSNSVIPIILIALTLSIAYLAIAETNAEAAKPFRAGTEALKLVIFKAVGYVIGVTPYAIVALTAHMVGSSTNLGPSFWSLVGLLGLVWGACFVHAYAINGVILSVFANVPVAQFFRKIAPAQLTAFTTQSSVGTLPVTTNQLTREVGVHPEIAHFTAPLGTTIGMPGCAGIWPILIAVWGINAYDIPYGPTDYLVLALLSIFVSVGTAGVPGAATVAAATVLSAAGLPLEFVAVTIPISIIADTARTMSNVTAAAVSATVVARQTGLLDDEIFAGRAAFREVDEALVPAAAPVASATSAAPASAAPVAVHAASAVASAPTTAGSFVLEDRLWTGPNGHPAAPLAAVTGSQS
ncbi:MAG: dicarboxylate/amino acid:cation symporter [Solirubrobacteraceae bacterium]|nr:dicarboxylate/amino acid:cation symporter [Solirubrobacteraceae bacterium]